MQKVQVIHWFRRDLRLTDNPALWQAAQIGNILPLYILDEQKGSEYCRGEASNFWLHHSLLSLQKSLNGKLNVYKGNPAIILPKLAQKYSIQAISWNRLYEPEFYTQDQQIKEQLLKLGIKVYEENSSLLWEPWQIVKEDGNPYKVFTPFYRKGCLTNIAPRLPLVKPSSLSWFKDQENLQTIQDLALLPKIPWEQKMLPLWQISETGAQQCLEEFLKDGLLNYKEGRNFPARTNVSKLSPYLHFGQISPNQLYYAVQKDGLNQNTDHFCSELGWREFSYNQLFFNPQLSSRNLQQKFNRFPWQNDQLALQAWQKGQTGIPLVDAGMRELWQTGYMHNRLRMVVGSFLVKNLLLDWRHGAKWFWNCLLDADLANNSAGWQWVAGCGADAAPYFRIFNPVMQGQRFDPEGKYIRQYVPELFKLPNKYLFSPWEAPPEALKAANVNLGINYPKPMVDLKASRLKALQSFASLKET